jgi:hypothetical protein
MEENKNDANFDVDGQPIRPNQGVLITEEYLQERFANKTFTGKL